MSFKKSIKLQTFRPILRKLRSVLRIVDMLVLIKIANVKRQVFYDDLKAVRIRQTQPIVKLRCSPKKFKLQTSKIYLGERAIVKDSN